MRGEGGEEEGGGRTDEDDVKSEDLALNISRGTKRETKISQVVENLVAKFSRIAGKKDDYEKFDEQFGKRLKLGDREDLTYRTCFLKRCSSALQILVMSCPQEGKTA